METRALRFALFTTKSTEIRDKNMPFYERKKICLNLRTHLLILFILRKEASLMARSKRLESGIQDEIVDEIQALFPGSIVSKINLFQGCPDLLILYRDKWATLETKRGTESVHQPNQDYYVNLMNEMSFSRFINKNNKEEVFRELQEAFGA